MAEKIIVYELPARVLSIIYGIDETLRCGMKATTWKEVIDKDGKPKSIEVPDYAHQRQCARDLIDFKNIFTFDVKAEIIVLIDEKSNGITREIKNENL